MDRFVRANPRTVAGLFVLTLLVGFGAGLLLGQSLSVKAPGTDVAQAPPAPSEPAAPSVAAVPVGARSVPSAMVLPLPVAPTVAFAQLAPRFPKYRSRARTPAPVVAPQAMRPQSAATGPRIAIVLDDLGPSLTAVARAIALDPAVTLAFLPYAEDVASLVARARNAGHEVLLHMPMEPIAGPNDPGPNALLIALDQGEIVRRFRWAMDRVPGAVGFNNHMGSLVTADRHVMALVMAEAKARGLMFLDSRTSPKTVAIVAADRQGLPRAARDVFLDNEMIAEKIAARLAETERVARRRGGAIAIGHPHTVTLEVLERWIPDARARGFVLAPISAMAKVATPATATPVALTAPRVASPVGQ